jgi:hypothetical protein
MLQDDTTRTIEEAYCSAANSSDLRVEADRRGDADILIAAGWTPGRVGAALLRLHSEWDRVEKPQRPNAAAVARMAAALTINQVMQLGAELLVSVGSLKPPAATDAVAKAQAQAWYTTEIERQLMQLKTWPEVRAGLVVMAQGWGFADPLGMAAAVLRYWLDQTCGTCHGTKWALVPGTDRQSGKACRMCHGSGLVKPPFGEQGKRLAAWLDDCASTARGSIGHRLRATRT